jgi:hypothetical protein
MPSGFDRQALRSDGAALAARSRAEQGLPRYLDDPAVLAKLVALLVRNTARQGASNARVEPDAEMAS